MHEEKKNNSFCNQSRSFRYPRQQNVLTGQTGPFRVKQFIAIKMKTPSSRLMLKGNLDETLYNSIVKEISSLLSNYLVLYKLTNVSFGWKFLIFSRKTLVTIEYKIPDGYVSLEDYVENNHLDENKIISLIYFIWEAFKSIVESYYKSSNHVRLLSLHPRNVLIKEEKEDNKVYYQIKFMVIFNV